MPALPELGDTSGHIRLAEILPDTDSEQLGSPGDDVDTACKIRIQLNAVKEGGDQDRESRVPVLFKSAEHFIDDHRSPFRDDHLFKEAPEHPEDPLPEAPVVEPVGSVQLRGKFIVAVDGSLEDGGKIGGEQGEPEEIPLGAVLSPAYIDQITHGLEGIEGNAQRQYEIHHRDLGPRVKAGKQAVEVCRYKTAVFQHAEDPEIEQQDQRQDQALFFLDQSLEFLFLRAGELHRLTGRRS